MIKKLAIPLLALSFLALAPLALAAAGDQNGSVQPGSSCIYPTDCADVNGVDYVCDGTCQQAAGTQGDTCANNNGCIDSLTCVIPSGQTIGTCQQPGGLNTPLGGQQAPTGNTPLGGQQQTTSNSGGNTTLINPLKAGTSLESLLSEILTFVVRIGTIVIVLMVIYSGFKFVMARGEPGKISEAREALMWTVVGALILLGAQAIASAIQATATAL
jgi:hypothetical protein